MHRISTLKESVPPQPSHERHRPEKTRLYRIIDRYYPEFRAYMAEQGRSLPYHVQKEFDQYLKCGRLEHGFLRVQCSTCHHERLVAFSCKRRGFCPSCGARRMSESAALLVDEVLPHEPIRQLLPWMACSRAMQELLPRVLSFPFQLRFLFASRPELMGKALGIVHRAIASHLVKKAGKTQKTAQTGSVTLIQRFGSALNLNVHFHMLFLDGVYAKNKYGKATFQRTNAPTQEELARLVHTISHRVARYLERQGILERDEENSYLQLDGIDEDPMQQLIGCSVSYRIAVGPQQGRKVFTLQTLPAVEKDDRFAQVAKEAGFSLHAGVAAQAWERDKLERLCRYISRPAISEKRLSLTSAGNIRYQLKTPYSDGTTHVIFEPLDFISKLASLVPKPKVNLTRFHGVFAPNSKHRITVTPAKRGKGKQRGYLKEDKTPDERRSAMTWAQRLKRVFNIDVEICSHCGGAVKVIACIEDQQIIDKILSHLKKKDGLPLSPDPLPEARAPPHQQ
ncbi:MAG: IS91 family transposase [Gammaproteobacteria bacterium]|nr:IS91 family transposase [Gammaproteobacteria bacterium]